MHDLAFVAILAALLAMGFRRPFLFVLTFTYIDIVAPQRLTYWLLNSVPVSLIAAVLAVGGWLLIDGKDGTRLAPRQLLLILLLGYCLLTTGQADFPINAAAKWSWVWKVLAFAIFLPFTLRTRLRIEALALVIVASAASLIIVGGVKTLFSGGGYGVLNLMRSDNSGLYESSTLACVAVALIPIMLWLARHGTIFPRSRAVTAFTAALIFASLLIPVGTQARTGLVCIGVLGVLLLRSTKRRFLYLGVVAAGLAIAVPLLPASFTNRMGTIRGYQGDQSASTRLAVWQWTLDYVAQHPMGGGFDAYRSNKIKVETTQQTGSGSNGEVDTNVAYDEARAYHSSYFEMLGEQGYAGLALWLMIQFGGILRMELVRRRCRRSPDQAWLADIAGALQQAQIVYLVGAAFVGIAYQSVIYFLIGMQIALDHYAARHRAGAVAPRGFAVRPKKPATA